MNLKKPMIRSAKYLYKGKGQTCTISGVGDSIIECAHYSGYQARDLGKYGKLKAHDIFIADARRPVHREMDQYTNGRNYTQGVRFFDGIARTQVVRHLAGLIWRSVDGVSIHEELDRDVNFDMWSVELDDLPDEAHKDVFHTYLEFFKNQIEMVYDGELIVKGFNDRG